MDRKAVALFLLPAFLLFNVSCISTKVKNAPGIETVSPQAAIVSVVTKSGAIVEFRKKDPARIVPGSNAIVGRTLQVVDVSRADIQKSLTDEKGRLVLIVLADGSTYQVVNSAEEGDKIHVSTYLPTTIPLSDVQQVSIRKGDTGRTIFAGAGVIVVIVVAVGFISILVLIHAIFGTTTSSTEP